MGYWATVVKIIEAIIEAAKVARKVKAVIDTLNNLSREGLQGLIRSYLVGSLVEAAAKEIKLPSDEAAGLAPKAATQIGEEIRGLAATMMKEGASALAAEGVSINLQTFLTELDAYLAALLRGRAVAGGPEPVRNATGAGDPVRLATGEFEHSSLDLELDGAGIAFKLRRTYRSGATFFGSLGPGWQHSYDLWLREENELVITLGTGHLSEQRFVRHPRFNEPAFAYFVPPDGIHDVIVTDGTGSFRFAFPSGGNSALRDYERDR